MTWGALIKWTSGYRMANVTVSAIAEVDFNIYGNNSMKKIITGSIIVASVVLSGCALSPTPVGTALLFSDVKGPFAVDDSNAQSVKTGKACATNTLGLVATGDASIEAAKRAGDITKVSNVNTDQFSVLGLFNKFCTVVVGE